jgi:hypothetical protein
MNYIDRTRDNPINFCHISPTPYLQEFTSDNGAHLLLAHLVEEDDKYAEFYAGLADSKLKIMDNSAFEMFKQGRPVYESIKLISMAKKCNADVIVMSDYPKEEWRKTRDAALRMADDIKSAGFSTFYVPQSEIGDIEGVTNSFKWALLSHDLIDLIGMSILTCPIAFGVNETKHESGGNNESHRSDAYKLQRFLSRWRLFSHLKEQNILGPYAWKRFHCLGMTDGPNEIRLLKDAGFADYIYSWDSSAAVWAGLNGISFDNSPSGLHDGKFELEVDFNHSSALQSNDKDSAFKLVRSNIEYINRLCHLK